MRALVVFLAARGGMLVEEIGPRQRRLFVGQYGRSPTIGRHTMRTASASTGMISRRLTREPLFALQCRLRRQASRCCSRRTSHSAALINRSRDRHVARAHARVSRVCAVATARADGPRSLRSWVSSATSRLRLLTIVSILRGVGDCGGTALCGLESLRGRRVGMVLRSGSARSRAAKRSLKTVAGPPVSKRVTSAAPPVTFR